MTTWYLMLLSWAAADAWWWWLADRRLRRLPGRPGRRRAGRWVLTVFAAGQLAYVLYFFANSLWGGLPPVFPTVWEVAGYVWHLFVLPLTLLLVVLIAGGYRAARAVRWLLGKVRPRHPGGSRSPAKDDSPHHAGFFGPGSGNANTAARPSSPQPAPLPDPPRLTRRQALGVAAAALPPLATAGLTTWATSRLGEFRVRRCELRLPGLPPDLDGLTIAHVTDLHIGRFLPEGTAARVAEATNRLAADLVAVTGDVNDMSAPNAKEAVQFLRALDPRHGLAVIEGNHDVMGGAARYEDPVREAGMPLLLDAALTFRVPGRTTPVQLMGIVWGEPVLGRYVHHNGADADKTFRMSSADATAASIGRVSALRQPDAFPVLLAHHPHAFDAATAAGFPLVLAGHTHGGQIMLTDHIGVGPWRFRYWAGLYHKGASRLFVANGIGSWFPVRVNAPAEIVHLRLKRGAEGREA